MPSKPQVTLTFAGDSSKLESAFAKVGQSARGMEAEVGKASSKVGESADSFDRAGEAADNMDTKAMGFRDTMTGVQDTMGGVSEIAKGNLFDGFLLLGTGIGDLGSGLYNFLIPTLKATSTQMIGSAVQTVRATAANTAHRVASLASAVATNVMTVAQKALNLAMRANPIGLVITAIALLVGAIVWAYKNSETFRRIVNGALNGVLAVARAVGRWFRETFWPWLRGVWTAVSGAVGTARATIAGHLNALVKWLYGIPGRVRSALSGIWNGITAGFGAATGWVTDKVSGFVKWAGGIPGRMSSAVRGMFDGIKDAFRSAINWVINRWNDLSFGIPGVDTRIPGVGTIGGFTLNTPNIPTFHQGGIMPGAPGTEGLARLQAGERITPAHASRGSGTFVIQGDGSKLGDLLVEVLRKAIRNQGGNVQAVLGPR